jgi:xanthine dehydrogenase YagR molybdenum-binding subunit
MSIAAAPEPKANMGKPEPRIDGRAKVTGQARYPADMAFPDAAYAWLVTSAVAKGRIAAMELAEARAVPGVLDILTHENMEEVREAGFFGKGGHMASTLRPLHDERIWHDGQIVAVVLAESPEAAREASYRVRVRYEEERPAASFDAPGAEAADAGEETPQLGDAEAAFAAAEVKLDAEYGTPTQHHNPIELFATTCVWSDGRLTIYEPSQFVYGLKSGVAERLGIAPEKIHVISSYVGGAFGSKGSMTPRTALVALAAKRINRPVKLVATRDQGFTVSTYRAETRHHIRLGARQDGTLVGYSHEGWEVSSRPDSYLVAGVSDSAHLYGYGAVKTKVNVVHADRSTPGYMRSPPVVPYIYAIEAAMDELAIKLGLDPVEFRRVNDTMTDPIEGKPWSSRSLMRCYDQAAEAFGWKRRDPRPGSMRQGEWLVGWGCATALYPTHVGAAAVRVRLMSNGDARVQTAAHEIGNGIYTVLGQMAAEQLGVPVSSVKVEVGDTELPPAPVAGGSNTTASTCNAVMKACEAIRSKLFHAAVTANDGPLSGRNAGDLVIKQGRAVAADGAGERIEDLFGRLGVTAIEEYAEFIPEGLGPDAIEKLYAGKLALTGGSHGKKIMYAMGAEFVEVRVHHLTREIRVPRIVGAFAAGRLMNTRTAHSQLMGGMIWGVSSALHEATEIDRNTARYVNDNLADYLVPVNADVGDVEVILVSEEDHDVNPAGIKGLGELANVGTAAAIANAVYHATGKRLRQLPIRVEHLLDT